MTIARIIFTILICLPLVIGFILIYINLKRNENK